MSKKISDLVQLAQNQVSGTLLLETANTGVSSNSLNLTQLSGYITSTSNATANIEASYVPFTGTVNVNNSIFLIQNTISGVTNTINIQQATQIAINSATQAGIQGSALVLVGSNTGTNISALQLINCFTDTYKNYILEFDDIKGEIDGQLFYVQLSNTGGVSWLNTPSYYAVYSYYPVIAGATSTASGPDTAGGKLAVGLSENTGLNKVPLSGTLKLKEFRSTKFPTKTMLGDFTAGDSNYPYFFSVALWYLPQSPAYGANGTLVIDSIRFYSPTCNVSGNISIYGLNH